MKGVKKKTILGIAFHLCSLNRYYIFSCILCWSFFCSSMPAWSHVQTHTQRKKRQVSRCTPICAWVIIILLIALTFKFTKCLYSKCSKVRENEVHITEYFKRGNGKNRMQVADDGGVQNKKKMNEIVRSDHNSSKTTCKW